MLTNQQILAKCIRIADRCRTAKNWTGALSARSAEKSNVGQLYIYQLIGADFFGDGVTADNVRKALDGMKGVDTLNIYINSEGGDVFEAKAIYTQLKRFSATKVVHVDGIAASAATYIAMAGDKIVTAPEGTWMIHEAWGWAAGDASKLRDYADLLDMMNDDIAAVYAKRTGNEEKAVRKMMAETTWMSAAKALELKFTDSLESYDDAEGDDEEEKDDAKAKAKLPKAVVTTDARISAMTSELLQFRAARAKLLEQRPVSTSRASAAPADRRPAVR